MPYEIDDDQDDLQEDESPAELGAPSPGESFTDEFNPYDYVLEEGPDGLPVEALDPWGSADNAPIPLTPETLQCLAQGPSKWNPEGLSVCRYYKRQRVHNPKAPDKPILQRFCGAPWLRGINGAAMSLSDAGIFECEFRDPPDPRSKLVLDVVDQDKIQKGRQRIKREVLTGKVHGFRMFRTPEDVAAGRFTVPDSESEEAHDLQRPKIKLPIYPDPLGPDDEDNDERNVDEKAETT